LYIFWTELPVLYYVNSLLVGRFLSNYFDLLFLAVFGEYDMT